MLFTGLWISLFSMSITNILSALLIDILTCKNKPVIKTFWQRIIYGATAVCSPIEIKEYYVKYSNPWNEYWY